MPMPSQVYLPHPNRARSHFLGMFPGVLSDAPHDNLSADCAWADLGAFEQKALALIRERFGLRNHRSRLQSRRRWRAITHRLYSTFVDDAQSPDQRDPRLAKRRRES